MGKTKDYTDEQERIARYAKAMGHPARMAILQFLAGRETCFFGDIHEELPIAKATVSQHLKELKEAGLIQGEILLLKTAGFFMRILFVILRITNNNNKNLV